MPKPRRSAQRQIIEGPATVGRPLAVYDPQIAELVLEEMARGKASLSTIVREHGFPDRSVIFRWVLENREFAQKFMIAREIQIHGFVDDMVRLTDEAPTKELPRVAAQIKARQWYASRLLPKTYGEHVNVDQNVTQNPLPAGVYNRMTAEERDQLRAILTAAMDRETLPEPEDGLIIEGNRQKR